MATKELLTSEMVFAILILLLFLAATRRPRTGHGWPDSSQLHQRVGTMSCLGTEPTDKSSWDIKRRIINLLYQRGVSSAQRLNIEMENGTVTVRGTVASFYERRVCVSCCQHVPGVFGLLDEIKVDSPISKPSATERF